MFVSVEKLYLGSLLLLKGNHDISLLFSAKEQKMGMG